jgi:hypothetical protein
MSQITTEEYIKRQHAKLEKLKTGVALHIAAQDTHVKMVERIFEQGETAQGNHLGYNTTDPLYVNPKNSPKNFPKKGKTGKSKFENGENHKTGYFDSYADFRKAIGKTTSYMNLNLFGVLQNDFAKGVIKLAKSAFASTVTQEANKVKLEKFATYFKLNKEERESFKDVLEYESLKILR